jgi:hypothetical protein
MGALKPGYRYELTLRFGFAPLAGNEYQGQGPLTVAFHAEAAQVNAGALNAFQAGFGDTHLPWLTAQIAKQP